MPSKNHALGRPSRRARNPLPPQRGIHNAAHLPPTFAKAATFEPPLRMLQPVGRLSSFLMAVFAWMTTHSMPTFGRLLGALILMRWPLRKWELQPVRRSALRRMLIDSTRTNRSERNSLAPTGVSPSSGTAGPNGIGRALAS